MRLDPPVSLNPSDTRWVYPLLVVAACVLAVLVRLPLLDRPLDRDEGLYAYMAQRMAQGAEPYRDVFSDKPPVGFVLYRVFLATFGSSTAGIHFGGALWVAAAVAALYGAARALGAPPAMATAAAFLYAVHNAEATMQGSSINLELLLLPFALTAVAAASSGALRMTLLAGTLMGLAGLTKQQAIGYGLFGLFLVLSRRNPPDKPAQVVRRVVAYVLGAAAVLGIVTILFAVAGAFDDFLEGVLTYNLTAYVRREPLSRAPENLLRAAVPIVVHRPILFALAAAGMLFRNRLGPRSSTLLIWFGLSFLSVSLGFRYYPHYFQLTAPVVCVSAARALHALLHTYRWWFPLAVAGCTAVPLGSQFGYFFRWDAREHVHRLYGPELFHRSADVAIELQRRVRESETVFVFGSEPQIYFLAGRPCAVKYAFIHPLTVATPRAALLQRQVARELAARPPAAIVLVLVDMSHMYEPGADDFLERQVVEMCKKDYRPTLLVYDDRLLALGPGARPGRSLLRRALAIVYVRRDAAAPEQTNSQGQ